jgi:hypothetical protein
MLDLLLKQVTEGLSPEEQRALDALDSASASAYLKDFERAVAALDIAAKGDGQPLPAALASKIESQAAAHFAAQPKTDELAEARARRQMAPSRRGSYGWLAAAACLVLALFGWLRSPPPPPAVVVQTPPASAVEPPQPVAPPTDAEERQALLAKGDSLKITLGATKDPDATGVTGDVVWDQSSQKGFFHFVGLKSNDPAVRQYQIWIFDAARDKRYPIDGGVFDIPADGNEVIIPIRAALMVLKPAAFAVTVEKPGGVVVSAREHVLVLGAAPAGNKI